MRACENRSTAIFATSADEMLLTIIYLYVLVIIVAPRFCGSWSRGVKPYRFYHG